MSVGGVKRQMSGQPELSLGEGGEAPQDQRSGETLRAAKGDVRSGNDDLLERVVERGNLKEALRRVRENRGSPGVDGMTVDELVGHLQRHWPTLRATLLAETYQPRPVLRRDIEKSGGGTRTLGIPCVLDRFVQQALLQVLQPIFDPTFSNHSYGFRPGRSAHDAVRVARSYVQEGRWWVVDVDLEKFFDRVNHDVLMSRLAKRLSDKRVLGLIRRYLEAGIMTDGVVLARHEGTPQGGPLSPLLANVLLDEVDKELERRGHAFVRYADDNNVYVKSKRAGERVMQVLQRLYGRLKLRINESKSAVARAWERKFLGFSFWVGRGRVVHMRIAPQAMEKMKTRVREETSRTSGRSIAEAADRLTTYLRGWHNYFRLADTPQVYRRLDAWIRRRLRALQLSYWGCRSASTVYRALKALGVDPWLAFRTSNHCRRRWWAYSNLAAMLTALPQHHFDSLGLYKLSS